MVPGPIDELTLGPNVVPENNVWSLPLPSDQILFSGTIFGPKLLQRSGPGIASPLGSHGPGVLAVVVLLTFK